MGSESGASLIKNKSWWPASKGHRKIRSRGKNGAVSTFGNSFRDIDVLPGFLVENSTLFKDQLSAE